MNMHRIIAVLIIAALASGIAHEVQAKEKTAKWPPHIQSVFDATRPREFDRSNRLPLYIWQAMDPGPLDDKTAEYPEFRRNSLFQSRYFVRRVLRSNVPAGSGVRMGPLMGFLRDGMF